MTLDITKVVREEDTPPEMRKRVNTTVSSMLMVLAKRAGGTLRVTQDELDAVEKDKLMLAYNPQSKTFTVTKVSVQ